MEMLNIGLLEAIVVDDWKANIWGKPLPKIKEARGARIENQDRIAHINSPSVSHSFAPGKQTSIGHSYCK